MRFKSKIKGRERDTEVILRVAMLPGEKRGANTGASRYRAWAESQEKARQEEPWKGCSWWPQMQPKLGRRGGGGGRGRRTSEKVTGVSG